MCHFFFLLSAQSQGHAGLGTASGSMDQAPSLITRQFQNLNLGLRDSAIQRRCPGRRPHGLTLELEQEAGIHRTGLQSVIGLLVGNTIHGKHVEASPGPDLLFGPAKTVTVKGFPTRPGGPRNPHPNHCDYD